MKTNNRQPKVVKFFTDEDHKGIFLFQEGISSRGYGGSKPTMKTLSIKSSGKNKVRVR